MSNIKAAILTLGCRVNQSESSVLEETLRENGLMIVNLHDNPDYCVINTCTVTAKSDSDSRNLIRRAKKTGAEVIVTGCYSELWPSEARKVSEDVRIVQSNNKDEILNMILRKQVKAFYSRQQRSRPYVKVQDGCNFRCSYCAVPLARGRSVSVEPLEVISRVNALESEGYNEIVLTGIHLGSYGQDLNERLSLSGLLKVILDNSDIRRIRLSSLEISEIDDTLIELMKSERICRHLHLPLQSGSDKILKLMKRNYNAAAFRDKILLISDKLGEIAIGCDVIAGFPGEDENDYRQSYNLIKSLPFSYLHIFPFSPRPGTDAANMTDGVPYKIKTERVRALKQLAQAKQIDYLNKQIGKALDIVIEGEVDNKSIGRSSNYLSVEVESTHLKHGSMVIVRSDHIAGLSISANVIS